MFLHNHVVWGFVFAFVTGVSWFFTICLYMIHHFRYVCGFVFTLVTWVWSLFVSCLYVILQIRHVYVVVYSHCLQGCPKSLQVVSKCVCIYDTTRRNLKQRWGILTTENLLTTIVTCQFLVNTVFPYSGLLQL